MKRIEIHLTEEETKTLDEIASADGRSRKNLCETEKGVKKILTKKELHFEEIYEVKDEDLQFYCYEPCYMYKKTRITHG